MPLATLPSAIKLVLPATLLFVGCGAPEANSTYDATEIRQVLTDPGPGAADVDAERRARWSIALATLSLGDHRATAESMQEILARDQGLTDTYIESRQDRSILYFGAYNSIDDPRLQADLTRVKNLVIGERQPFVGAFVVPPDTLDTGGDSPYSLTAVRRRYGVGVRLYTLEIGVYDDPDRDLAIRSAEEAVRVYREQGEPAFFYHGPHRSSVTIGVLAEEHVDLDAPGFGPNVRELRLRHPHRAVNGRLVNVREGGRDRGTAPSRLMLIP